MTAALDHLPTCRRSFARRERSGPTSRKRAWMIRVDTCTTCGKHRPTGPLSWLQYVWLRAWNRQHPCPSQPHIPIIQVRPTNVATASWDQSSTATDGPIFQ